MSTRPRYTSKDLELLPRREGWRYEIVDGELYVSTQPHWHHQYACSRVDHALQSWNDRTGLGLASSAPSLIFSPDDDVAPDLVWISRDRLAGLLDQAGHLRGAPELVVEVLSPGRANEQRDRDKKLQLYSRQGIEEYWIGDWRTRTGEVYRQRSGALDLDRTLAGDTSLTSPLLPGFACPIVTFWNPFG